MSKYIFTLSLCLFSLIVLCVIGCSDENDSPMIADEPTELLKSITINGIAAQKAGESTYTVKLPYDADLTKVSFSAEASGTLSLDGRAIANNSVIDLSRPVTLTLTTSGDLQQKFTLAARYSELPVVYVDTPAPITSKDSWVKNGTLSIFTDTTDAVLLEKVQYKGRGNSTWGYTKKPYAIKLADKTEILGMPKHKRWVLLANYLDKTLMRNAVAFEVGRIMSNGLGWTPRGHFVDLVFNGRYVGNYYLCEQIKVDKNRVNIAEIEAGEDDDSALTGGYLLEYDTNFDEVNKFRSELRRMPVNIKEPDEDILTPAHLNYIKDYINNLERVLAGNFSFSDISALIDIDSFIDWWIAHELVQNSEPLHPKSSYFHKDRDGVLHAGPIWDFDYGTLINNSGKWLIKNSLYYKELFSNPDFTRRVKERWSLHKPALETVADFIDSTFESIRESAEINQLLWPTPDQPNLEGTLSYPASVTRLKQSYLSRLQWMDSEIMSW